MKINCLIAAHADKFIKEPFFNYRFGDPRIEDNEISRLARMNKFYDRRSSWKCQKTLFKVMIHFYELLCFLCSLHNIRFEIHTDSSRNYWHKKGKSSRHAHDFFLSHGGFFLQIAFCSENWVFRWSNFAGNFAMGSSQAPLFLHSRIAI